MILGVELPFTPAQAGAVVRWIRRHAERLRPWLETFAVAQAARDGVEVPEGAVPAIFEYVTGSLDRLMAWPDMDPDTKDAARAWYARESQGGPDGEDG